MDSTSQIIGFLRSCDALCACSYTEAEQRIREVLISISRSRKLTELFDAAVTNFDYLAAKERHLRYLDRDGKSVGELTLPLERSERLAFIFCLFVEIDSKRIVFRDFLQKFFHVDGSFTASYLHFVEQIVRPFRMMIANCFPVANAQVKPAVSEKTGKALFHQLKSAIEDERKRLAGCRIDDDRKKDGELILVSLADAVGRNDRQETGALLCGYSYYLSYLGIWNGSEALFSLAEKL